MAYQLPDETTLAKYLCLLQRVFILARVKAWETDPQLAQLFDAVENVSDLLVAVALENLEARYPEWNGAFTRILADGAPEHWQQRWR